MRDAQTGLGGIVDGVGTVGLEIATRRQRHVLAIHQEFPVVPVVHRGDPQAIVLFKVLQSRGHAMARDIIGRSAHNAFVGGEPAGNHR